MAWNKKNLYRWHKRLGLTLGLILFLLGVSGIIITFRDELLPKIYSSIMLVTPTSERASLEQVILSAKLHLRDMPFTHLYTAERDDTATMIFFRPEGALLPHLVAIDPYTARVTGRMPLAKNIFGLALYLHSNLLLGKTGSWIVGSMGLLLTFFFISGLVIFWPKEPWMQKIKDLARSGSRGLHRGLGLFIGLPLVFSALTGFVLAFDLMQPIGRMLGDAAKPDDQVRIGTCSFEEQLNALSVLNPEQKKNLVSIHFCSPKSNLMKMSYGLHERSGHDGYKKIIVDPKTSEIVQRFDTTRDPSSWSANSLLIYPLHTGAYFGFWGQVIGIITGIALSILYITGLLPTLKRRFKK